MTGLVRKPSFSGRAYPETRRNDYHLAEHEANTRLAPPPCWSLRCLAPLQRTATRGHWLDLLPFQNLSTAHPPLSTSSEGASVCDETAHDHRVPASWVVQGQRLCSQVGMELALSITWNLLINGAVSPVVWSARLP